MAKQAKDEAAPTADKPTMYVLSEPLHPDEFHFPTDGALVGEWDGSAPPVEPEPGARPREYVEWRDAFKEWQAPREAREALCKSVYLRPAMQPLSNSAPRRTLEPTKIRKVTRDGDALVFELWGALFARAVPCADKPRHPEGR